MSESVAEMEARLIREGEQLLGKMIQNATVRGLKPTTEFMYRDDKGEVCEDSAATACCALGAAFLVGDSTAQVFRSQIECIGGGNDGLEGEDIDTAWGFEDPHIAVGYTIGAAFQHAMGARGRR